MHIEPEVVTGAKLVLSYGTAAGAAAYTAKTAMDSVREKGVVPFAGGAMVATALTFVFFQVFPHFPVGVSEVHLILGSTLFLLFGVAPAAAGLALGLLAQGVFFAPIDLPQYTMNVTTLLVPLFMVSALAKRIIAPNTAYVDLTYVQALKLSTAFQAGVLGHLRSGLCRQQHRRCGQLWRGLYDGHPDRASGGSGRARRRENPARFRGQRAVHQTSDTDCR